ncbi:MAG: DUF6884 domain-containing protein [Bacteroidota bacterium]
MRAFVTYCSAAKDKSAVELPAISRYRSERIRYVHEAAKAKGAKLLILSGAYGLLAPEDPIPYYDHLLAPHEVATLSQKAAMQLREQGISTLDFYMVDVSQDGHVKAYLDCMTAAAEQAGVTHQVILVDFDD